MPTVRLVLGAIIIAAIFLFIVVMAVLRMVAVLYLVRYSGFDKVRFKQMIYENDVPLSDVKDEIYKKLIEKYRLMNDRALQLLDRLKLDDFEMTEGSLQELRKTLTTNAEFKDGNELNGIPEMNLRGDLSEERLIQKEWNELMKEQKHLRFVVNLFVNHVFGFAFN